MSIPEPVMERQSPDKKLFVAAGSHIVAPLHKWHIFVTGAAGTTSSVTLPNVSEAEGRHFIVTRVGAATPIARVYYSDGTTSGTLSVTAETTGVSLTFQSDGIDWTILRTSV